jgi:hypothetical protein
MALIACILVLPIWGGNMAPALIMAGFGFGLMQRDGAFVIAGWLGVAAFTVFVWLAWEVIYDVLKWTLNAWAAAFG